MMMSETYLGDEASPVSSLYFASKTAMEVIKKSDSRPQTLRTEPRYLSECVGLDRLIVDDRCAMNSLMKRTAPVFAPRSYALRSEKVNKGGTVVNKSVFDEWLEKSIENRVDSADLGAKVMHTPDNHKAVEEASAKPSINSKWEEARASVNQKRALQVWMEEEEELGYTDSGTYSFHTSHSLINAVDKGRFPLDANLAVRKAVKRVDEDVKKAGEGWRSDDLFDATQFGVSLPPTVVQKPSRRPTMLDRVKKIPVRSWELLHNITTTPELNDCSSPKSKQKMLNDPSIISKWRHRFDYVNYKRQFDMDESLFSRDVCRNMIIRHQKCTLAKPSMEALADMFERNSTCKGHKRHNNDSTREDFVWCTVWKRQANEIALERERKRIIEAVKQFRLCVEAASLSRAAVSRLQRDLIVLIQGWPSNYRRRHIFTSANFVEWIKKRCPASSSPGSGGAAGVIDTMASKAEASFVEYVLSILPQEQPARPRTG
uniref:Uncharacterized protein n=1 Tax=Trypanosoma congolense (strain IL3000) TaxID=1068625 RepID=G0UU77_TRYCI|nr:conserved hypothetical protein [Trypanosoma congolense IL3000]